jgi:DNA-binding SARP family transcriptional activator
VPRWSLRLLGPFSFDPDVTTLVSFRSDKVRALLAYLASEPGRPWSRSALAGLLWPDRPEPVARTNLRNALSNLRLVLDDARAVPPYLVVSPTDVRVDVAADHWVDVAALHDLGEPAGGATHDADDPGTVARLERALALIRGDFLEGFSLDSGPFADWMTTMRDRSRSVTVRTARALALAYARQGDPIAAEAATRRWLAFEPWDESAHRHLMRVLARQGQRSAALAQHEACRRVLAEELGIEPAAETAQLAAAIQAGEVGAEPSIAAAMWPGLASPADLDARLFVARAPELAALDAALRRVDAAGAGAMFVIGEAGSGKTELLVEFARRAQDDDPGLLVLWGHGSSFTGHGHPFEPFVQVARMLCGEAEAPPQARVQRAEQARRTWRRLAAIVDAFLEHGSELLGRFVSTRSLQGFARQHAGVDEDRIVRLETLAARGRSPPSPGSSSILLEQFTAVVRCLASRQRMLLLLDDLQWIDASSVELLFHLARGLGAARVLIVGAYRPEDLAASEDAIPHPLRATVSELVSARRAGLVDLTGATDAAFVDAVLDTEPNALSADFRARLAARTGGHALFTIELLRGMQLRGDLLRNRQGRWIEGPSLRWDDLPTRVEAAIGARIGHLSAACRGALEIASVEGEVFTAEVVAAISGRPVTETCDLISQEAGRRQRLVEAHALRPLADGGVAQYRFRHGLFQTYLVQRLDAIERARLHGHVGRELERIYRGNLRRYPETHHALARHFEAAGMAMQAVEHFHAAASHAQRLFAYDASIDHLRRALDLLGSLPASSDRDGRELQLQLMIGTALTATKGWANPDLATAYARVEELCDSLEDRAHRFRALWQLSVFHVGRSEHAEMNALHERIAKLAEEVDDRALMSLARLNVTDFYLGRFEGARRRLEAAGADPDLAEQRDLAERFGMAPAVVALAYLAECLWLLDLPRAAEEQGRKARELAVAVNHPMSSCYAFGRACWLATFREDRDATAAHAEDLLRLARSHGLGSFILAGTFFEQLASRDGTPDARLESMYGALERYREAGNSLHRAAFLTHYARACGEAAHADRGLVAVDAALVESARSGERWFDAETWRTKAALLRLEAESRDDGGRSERAALACLATAVRIARAQGAVALVRRAEADGVRLRDTSSALGEAWTR